MAALIELLAKRAPHISVAVFLASILGAWASLEGSVFKALALVVGALALMLLFARGMRAQFRSTEELGFVRNRDWIAYELGAKGMPKGTYALVIFGFCTWILTGVQSAYAWLAFSGLMLTVAWSKANVRYPADAGER